MSLLYLWPTPYLLNHERDINMENRKCSFRGSLHAPYSQLATSWARATCNYWPIDTSSLNYEYDDGMFRTPSTDHVVPSTHQREQEWSHAKVRCSRTFAAPMFPPIRLIGWSKLYDFPPLLTVVIYDSTNPWRVFRSTINQVILWDRHFRMASVSLRGKHKDIFTFVACSAVYLVCKHHQSAAYSIIEGRQSFI